MSSGGDDQFIAIAGEVARELWGDPNRKLSSKDELRFGSKGSKSVDLKAGTFFDYSLNEGGGVLWAVSKEIGGGKKDAIDWLKSKGFNLEDRRQDSHKPARESNRNYGPDGAGDYSQDGPPMRPVQMWDYVDEAGELIFQVVRLENGVRGKDGKPEKTYRQRRRDPSKKGGWDWSTKGCRIVPYRLPELLEAIKQKNTIFIVEGEKAADRLLDLGVPATTNPRGAGKWVDELTPFFKGVRVVVLADDDPQAVNDRTGEPKFHEDGRPVVVGIDHANAVARSLYGTAREVKVVQLTDRKRKEDVVDWLDDGGSIEALYDIAAATKRYEPEPFRSKFHAVTWSDMDKPGPEHEWLIKGILTRAEVGMCAGPSKSGKSFLVIDAALAVARGAEWFGRRVIQGGVIYQAGEGQKGLKKRIRAYRQDVGLTTEDHIDFVLLPSRIDLYHSDDHTEALIAECRYWASTFEHKLELIVIDTFATATAGASENDGKDVSVVLERCARLCQATGAAVLLVHHMNAEGSKVRGHSSILGNLENVLIVKQQEGMHDEQGRQLREAVVDKNKDGEDGAKLRFVLKSVTIGYDEDGDPVTSCVVVQPNGEGSDDPVEQRPNVTDAEAIFLRALEKAIADCGSPPPSAMGLPRSVGNVVEWKQFLKAYDSLQFDSAPPENEAPEAREKRLAARRQATKRAGERLLLKGFIGRDDPYVWPTGKRPRGYRRSVPASHQDGPPPDDPPPQSTPPSLSYDDDPLFGED